jgi:hypothetical protein
MLSKKSGLILILFLCTVTMFLTSCSKDDAVNELKLSTTDAVVYTDSIAYAFDIVSGNGGYQVTVSNDGVESKVAVKGNHVNVDLINPSTRVTVTDVAGQSTSFYIYSSNASLAVMETLVGVSYGHYLTSKLNWGNGGYYIRSNGEYKDVASVDIDDNGNFIVKGLHPGSVSLLISDSRGTTNHMTVEVGSGADITDKALTYAVDKKDGLGNYTFPIKYGVGGWKVISCSSALKNPWLVVLPKDGHMADDLLQVSIPKDANGTLNVQLKDDAGNLATLTIEIK